MTRTYQILKSKLSNQVLLNSKQCITFRSLIDTVVTRVVQKGKAGLI